VLLRVFFELHHPRICL